MECNELIPLMNRVLVQRVQLPMVTKGGILLPQKKDNVSQIGKVIAVGKGAILADGKVLKSKLKKGDFVLVNDWMGYKVPKFNNSKQQWENMYLYSEDDLLGVVNKYKH